MLIGDFSDSMRVKISLLFLSVMGLNIIFSLTICSMFSKYLYDCQ